MVPPANSELGYYSCYFLIPKIYGGLRPILDLRYLNHVLIKPLKVLSFEADPQANMPR